jgi:hypothetical protein
MRALAFLAAVGLAGSPVAATPILIADIAATDLLTPEERLDAPQAPEPAAETGAPALPDSSLLFVHSAPGTLTGVLDAGVVEAFGYDAVDAYRSTMTRGLLQATDEEFAVSPYALERDDSGAGVLDAGFDPAVADPVREQAGHSASSGGAPTSASKALAPGAQPDFVQATVSRVEPAALTLLGVCLFLIAAGGREWRRRNWHRRHLPRRR